MRILLLGSGAREHAILSALLAEDADHEIIVARGNAGIADDAETIALDPEAPKLVGAFALDSSIELVIIGPE
ncbi:MAG: phosphoribosylamine--glycine ligase N-terminal domain-containing protein, partial [Terrimesophilobacter sp.]